MEAVSETWSHWCYDQSPVALPVETPRCPQCGALNLSKQKTARTELARPDDESRAPKIDTVKYRGKG